MRKIFLSLFFVVLAISFINAENVKVLKFSIKDYNVKSFAALSLSQDRINGRNYLNKLREAAGLNSLSENSLLNQSAQNHAEYLSTNNIFSHYESSKDTGFTGYAPWDRVQHVGYSGSKVVENISAGDNDVYESIDNLFSAIYHRLGFLDFNINEVGIGEKYSESYAYKTVFVYNMGNSLSSSDKSLYNSNPKYVLWPYNNANNIMPVFYEEIPDPLPECSVSGYPVSIEFNPEKIATGSFSYLSFELYDDKGTFINSKVLTATNDLNSHISNYQFALMPLERLKWGAKYKAVFKYMENGETKEISWSFKTKSLDYPYYEVNSNNATFNIKPNQSYILYFPPNDCNDKFDGYSTSYTNIAPQLDFIDSNTLKVYSNAPNGSFIKINTSNGKNVTLKISSTDSAVYPSSEETEKTCSSENLEYCTTESVCQNAGGYWYDNQCNKEAKEDESTEEPTASSIDAHPSTPLNAVEYKFGIPQPEPFYTIVKVPASSSVYLQPSLYVDSSDIGKTASLVMYIYLVDMYAGFMLPVKNDTLKSIEKFTNLPNALDFTGAEGLRFDVYFGYSINSTLKYNAYRVEVTSK